MKKLYPVLFCCLLIFSFCTGSAQQPPVLTLPVKFGGLSATELNEGINLKWSNLTETDIVQYVIERSATGQNFSSVATVNPVVNNGGRADYQYTDKDLSEGKKFYRIKAVEMNGLVHYSNIAKINTRAARMLMTVYPNPVRGNQISLQLDNVARGNYTVFVYNCASQLISSQSISYSGGSGSQVIALNNCKPGLYYLIMNGPEALQKQFIVQ